MRFNPVPLLAVASAVFLVQGANRIYNALQFLAAGSTDESTSNLIERGSHSVIWAAVFAGLAVLAGYVRSRRRATAAADAIA